MADEKQKGSAGNGKAKATDDSVVEATYERREHIAHAVAMYGVPRHVVAGAFAVIDEKSNGEIKEDLAKSEVEDAIVRFQRRDITKEH